MCVCVRLCGCASGPSTTISAPCEKSSLCRDRVVGVAKSKYIPAYSPFRGAARGGPSVLRGAIPPCSGLKVERNQPTHRREE